MKTGIRKALATSGSSVFRVPELRRILGYAKPTLYVMLNRWVQEGSLLRLAPGLYALSDFVVPVEVVATQLYSPSYLSFETVLSRAGWLNTMPRTTTMATTRKSKTIALSGRSFQFRKLQPEFFFGYASIDGVPTASPEKALVDFAYLVDLGREQWPPSDLEVSPKEMKRALAVARKLSPGARRRVTRSLRKLRLAVASR